MNKLYKFLKALQPVLAILCVVTLFGLYFGSAEDMAQISLSGGTSKVSLGSVYAVAYAKAAAAPDSTVKGALVGLLLFTAYLLIYAVINLAVKFSRRFEFRTTPFRDKKIYTRALFSALCYPIYAALLVCTAVAYGVITSAELGLTVPGAGLTGALSVVTICFGLTIIAETAAAILRACDDGLKAQYSAKAREERQNKLRASADKPVPPSFPKPEYYTLLNCARHTKRLRIFTFFYLPVPIITLIFFILTMSSSVTVKINDENETLLEPFVSNSAALLSVILIAFVLLVLAIIMTAVILRKKPAEVEAASSRSIGSLKVLLGVLSWFLGIYVLVITAMYSSSYVTFLNMPSRFGSGSLIFKLNITPQIAAISVVVTVICALLFVFSFGYMVYAAYVRRKKAKVLRKFFFGNNEPKVVSVENGVKKYNTNVTDEKLAQMKLEYERVADKLKYYPHEVYEYKSYWYENVYPNEYGSAAAPHANPSRARCYMRKHAAAFKALLGVTIIVAVLLCMVIPPFVV